MSSMDAEERVRFVDIVAFACEIATFVLIIAGVNLLVDGGRSWLIGIALALVVAVGWARWIGPRSEHRLADPERYIAQASLFVAVAILMTFAGQLWTGVVFAAVSLAAFAATRSDRAL